MAVMIEYQAMRAHVHLHDWAECGQGSLPIHRRFITESQQNRWSQARGNDLGGYLEESLTYIGREWIQRAEHKRSVTVAALG
jgi:histone H3/H4